MSIIRNLNRNLRNNLWILVLLIVLCGCIYIFSKDKFESAFSDSEKKSKEDWFVYKDFFGEGEFYVKAGDVYKKSDFPEAVQSVLQEEENKCCYLKKEENRLIIESEYHFYIYDFETDGMEEYSIEYGQWRWGQIFREKIYFIEITEDDKRKLMAYNMVTGNVEKIDTGEYEPMQFHVRSDGAIGMWGVNAKGDEEYCFWENGKSVYIADKDESFGWTTLCGFTEIGIILEREYDDLILGTKTYVISKDGIVDILASINAWETLKALPEGRLIYEDNRIIAVDMTSGMVKAYDYNLSCTGELQWDIKVSEDMEFVTYRVEGDGIWGIWKLTDEDVYKRAALK